MTSTYDIRLRILLIVALFSVAAAIVFHAVTQRYDFANLNPRQFTRRDRWTGTVEVCTTNLTAPVICRGEG